MLKSAPDELRKNITLTRSICIHLKRDVNEYKSDITDCHVISAKQFS